MQYLFRKYLALFSLVLLTSNYSFSAENETPENQSLPNPYFMGVGGGYYFSGWGSQAVLELNMELFSGLVNKYAQSTILPYSISLFAGGTDPEILDVVETVPNVSIEDELLADLFPNAHYTNARLRHNKLENLSGSATKNNVLGFLETIRDDMTEEDEFRFYYTGHGAKSENYTANTLALWNGPITVPEFVSSLDTFNPKIHTQVVMVQCYSGGFADMNYVGGKVDAELSGANRCGFFSQVKDEGAAGCTPDILEREEYSPYFFAAYAGVNEKGEAVNADYNGDDKITSDEAHAYVLIHENSIDKPITTSTQLLRDENFEITHKLKMTKWEFFEKNLSPLELTILRGLQVSTGYQIEKIESPLQFIEEKISEINQQIERLTQSYRSMSEAFAHAQFIITRDLQMKFPIFAGAYGPQLGENYIMSLELIQKAKQAMILHADHKRVQNLFLERDKVEIQRDEWSRLLAKLKRIQYLLETKILATSLEQSNKDNVKQKYQQLKNCESKPFFSKGV